MHHPMTRPEIGARPTPNPAGGEWMVMPVPNLRRQLRLWTGGQRVRGSQSRLKPAPRSPLINQLQSPTTRSRTWGESSWLIAIVVHREIVYSVDVSGYEDCWFVVFNSDY
ncbi:hypothetical protein CDAR_110011 [Caerostris darwini]|uniref:Uncharacterized protein n=1 Tax=Caerostris darwini TaxID=1538125 RepID=A0AAV4P114_9ARAC|nr:hypothetical protein CDAR_110011 [Caerostris darwini]